MVLPPDPTTSIVVQRMLEHKADLIAMDGDTMLHMGERWLQLEYALDGQQTALAMELFEAMEAGEAVSTSALLRNKRYRSLLAQIQRELSIYNLWAEGYVEEGQLKLGKLGISHAVEATQLTIAEGGGGIGIYFDRLPISAVEAMVGVAGDGGPIYALLQQAYPTAVDKMTDALIRNTLLGVNPRQTAREMADGMAEGLTHNLTVARTEQLRVYREAARQQYQTSGLVDSYRRLCAKNINTCVICLSLDGEVYPTDELMHVHPSDRCTMVPNVTGMPQVQYQTGEQWLRNQPTEIQEHIMGKGAADLWNSGGIELGDLAQKVEHPTWGPSLRRTPLKDIGG